MTRYTPSRRSGCLSFATTLLCLTLSSFAAADTIRLAWNAPASMPTLQLGETLWYQLYQQRPATAVATPLVGVPASTFQVGVSYPTLAANERICWSLTLQKLNAAWQVMGESPEAFTQAAPATKKLCLDGAQPGELARDGWQFSADNSAPGYPARYAVDRSLSTFWHTTWAAPPIPPYPHRLRITLPQPARITGLRVAPRQDGNTGGIPRRWQVWIRDSLNKPILVASGTNTSETAPIAVALSPVVTTIVEWRVLDELRGAAWASAADVALFGTLPAPQAQTTKKGQALRRRAY